MERVRGGPEEAGGRGRGAAAPDQVPEARARLTRLEAGRADGGEAAGPDDDPVRGRVRRIAEAQHALASLTRAYAVVLDGHYMEALEAVVDDRFTALLVDLATSGAEEGSWRPRLNLARGPREA